jgi:hypothetical protein
MDGLLGAVIDASPDEESVCDEAANEVAGNNARDRAATSPTPTVRERFIDEVFLSAPTRKRGRLLSHLREHNTASLAFGCRKTPPGMTKGLRPEKEEKRVGGLRRCEVVPLRWVLVTC